MMKRRSKRIGICFLLFFLLAAALPKVQAQKKIYFPEESLKSRVERIMKHSGKNIVYDGNALRRMKVPALKTESGDAESLLGESLKSTEFTYRAMPDGSLVVKPKEKQKSNSVQQPARGGRSSIRGRVVESETSEPLPGATVTLAGTNLSALTDSAGYYRFNRLAEGRYTLEVEYLGFKTERVPVRLTDGRTSTCDIQLTGDNNVLGEVVIQGIQRIRGSVPHTNDKMLMQEIKAASIVVSGISSEQIAKSADRNAAQAVQRVSGVSIQDDKFVIVRGLNPRYNLTYLNDAVAPSTEVYSRAFALDLIPSRIIDKILVLKSSGPDNQADATGGVVKIYTKDAQTVKHFDIEVQGALRSGSTFKKMLTHQGGKWDWLGFDDGTRALPQSVPGYGSLKQANISQAEYASSFSPVLWHDQTTAMPNMQLTANYYDAFKLGGKYLSSLTSLSYKHEEQMTATYQQQGIQKFAGAFGDANDKISQDQAGTQTSQLNLLQNFSYKLGKNGLLQFKNFLLQTGTSTNTERISHPYYYSGLNKDVILSYNQRFLYSGNLSGTHRFDAGKHELKWNLGYSYTRQGTPDQRVVRYNAPASPDHSVGDPNLQWTARIRQGGYENPDYLSVQLGSISRTWMRNDDDLFNFSADYTFKPATWAVLHAGTFQQFKRRHFYRRIYTVNEGDLSGNTFSDARTLPGYSGAFIDPAIIEFNELDIRKVWSADYLRDDGSGLKVNDRTSGSDAYVGTEQNNAGYTSFAFTPLNGKIEVYGGLRAEYNRQRIGAAVPPSNNSINVPVLVDYGKLDWFPSINADWRPGNSFVFRGGYNRTVNRPEFRETSPFQEINYDANQMIQGNPNLVPCLVDNYNFRMEFYPRNNRKGEILSIGVFYKYLDKPIERINSSVRSNFNGSALPTDITYENADKAAIQGIEIEANKSLDFVPFSFFRDLTLIANLSLIKSEVTKKDTVYGAQTATIQRRLQGQAPYILNLGLYYDNAGSGTKASLIYNVVGESIYAASPAYVDPGQYIHIQGSLYRGSLIELPQPELDFSLTQRIGKGLQAKLAVQNLLDKAVRMAEDFNYTYKYEKLNEKADDWRKAGDPIASRYNPGRYFQFSLSYAF